MPEAPVLDPVREEVLRAAAASLAAQAPGLKGAQALLRPLYAALPTHDLAARAPEELAAAAASLAGLAEGRARGETRLRLHPPGPGRGAHAVAEIVTDDMPFLVDSALGAVVQQGRAVRELLHPILDGTSLMRVVIGPAAGATLPGGGPAGGWDAVEAGLRRAMSDVRAAVTDFDAMAAKLHAAKSEMPPGGEAPAFLDWLLDDNFVLLGHRRLMRDGQALRFVEEENLGLLRDGSLPVFDALANLPGLDPRVLESLAEPLPLTVAKANMRSTVHRPQHADVVATRIAGPDGQVVGARIFLGLFAAAAYNRNPLSIPLLREKVARILRAAGLSPEGHDGRALRNILDTWPRDELFQASDAEILAGAQRALDLSIRPRAALHLRRDPFGRFVSAIAWLPRESFDSRLRQRVGEMLARAHNGRLSTFYISLGDAPLARVHYIIGTNPARRADVDAEALEAAVVMAARGFTERLAAALADERGEAAAAELLGRWPRDAFPPAYRETASALEAAGDIAMAEAAVEAGKPRARVVRQPGEASGLIELRLAIPGAPLALADALPLFESLGLRALEEVPHRLTPVAGEVALHIFRLDSMGAFEEEEAPALLEALDALMAGRAEADGFNRLVLHAGLSWRECWLLRAMFKWLKQVGMAFSAEAVTAALVAEPEAARLLLALFRARFEPGGQCDDTPLEGEWAALMDRVADPDADRILRRFRTLLDAMLRTNFFQGKDYLAFKLDSARAGDMPLPRPWREIFVHSPTMEGCHLRAGPVARGGIRWSDRREDFRTEILGLMKAQRLKNVIIVPTGAKGGFVLKGTVPTERAAFQETGIAAYRTLVRGMLDLTDNLRGEEVLPPPNVVRLDGDDPYIVAAADKGTATFSDIANALSAEYGFWLGDAFASGGSAGYDHKEMGITARGAWVMIERHFVETLGRSIHDAPFDMVGVGDMSGDVFGNGLLLSRQTRLRAAFDHRHIFLDPDPDPARSHAERERLFKLPRSSWDDYDKSLISKGGGVFPRNLKTIPLTPEVREMLDLAGDKAEPAEIMRAILKAKVDLLYFGGIGTYVKASTESQAAAGDRANDALRVDGKDIRAKVVGEGANLGVTQAGRIEAARAGARINTDALDNSAGVSTSDHEVNIKILLTDAEAEGVLTRRQRDELLEGMTGEVAALVLRDNALQSFAVTLDEAEGPASLPAHAALMARLEAAGFLDRAVAGLPTAAELDARIAAGEALTRPELAALLPVAKLWLLDALEGAPLLDDPALEGLLVQYFPTPLRSEPFLAFAKRHRLRRELIATALGNMVANRLGLAALAGEGDPASVIRRAWLAATLFELEPGFDAAAAAPPAAGVHAALRLRELLAATAAGLPAEDGPLSATLEPLAEGVAQLKAAEMALPESDVCIPGLTPALGALVDAAPRLAAAPAIVGLARECGVPPAEAAASWGDVGTLLSLDGLVEAARKAPAPGPFGERARQALLADLAAAHRRLAAARLRGEAEPGPEERRLLREAARHADLAAVTVAARALA
jgi:glutamate dehydrogenase